MSQSAELQLEDLESARIIREMEVASRGDALKFCLDLLSYIDGQKTAGRAWGSYDVRLNYRGKGLESVDITDHHSIKFKTRDVNGAS